MNFLLLLQRHPARIIGFLLILTLCTSFLAGCGQQDSPDSLVGQWTPHSICEFGESGSPQLNISLGIWFFDNGHYALEGTPDTGGEYFVMKDSSGEYVEIDTKQENFVFSYSFTSGSSTSTNGTITLSDITGSSSSSPCTLQKGS